MFSIVLKKKGVALINGFVFKDGICNNIIATDTKMKLNYEPTGNSDMSEYI